MAENNRDRDNAFLAMFMDSLAGQRHVEAECEAMTELLEDESKPISVRDTAAYALGCVGYVPALPALRKYADREDTLGKCARRAIAQLDPPETAPRFCWIHVRDCANDAYGPFDSVDEVKADLRQLYTHVDGGLRDGDTLVAVHECAFIAVEGSVCDDVGDVLLAMEESLPVPFDDPVFEVHDEAKAQDDLRCAMQAWAARNVYVVNEAFTTGRLVVETAVARLLEEE